MNIAQVSMEEFVHPYGFDYNLLGETVSVDSIDLNAISMNIWVEVSRMNSAENNKVLFTSDFIDDNIQGHFRQYILSDQLEFEYTIDTITMKRIYSFTDDMGTRCGSYLYDYYLNQFIRDHAPENYPAELRTVHWDPERKIFVFVKPEDQFIEMKQGAR